MAVTIAVGGPNCLSFIASPLSELGSSLHLFSHPTAHDHDYLHSVRDNLPSEFLLQLKKYSVLWGAFRCRFLLPQPGKAESTLNTELTRISASDTATIVEHIAQAIRGGGSINTVRGVMSEVELQGRVLVHARARGPECEELAMDLFATPERTVEGMLGFFRSADDLFFRELWDEISPVLRKDAYERSNLVRVIGPEAALLDTIPNSVQGRAAKTVVIDKVHSGRIDLAKKEIVLVPTLVGKPLLVVKDEGRDPAIQYPILDPRTKKRPRLDVQLRRLTALSNPALLQLCRDMARESRSTLQLADRWGMDAAQVSRHLKQLRDADLVSVERRGHFVLYRLKMSEVAELGHDLLSVLVN